MTHEPLPMDSLLPGDIITLLKPPAQSSPGNPFAFLTPSPTSPLRPGVDATRALSGCPGRRRAQTRRPRVLRLKTHSGWSVTDRLGHAMRRVDATAASRGYRETLS